MPKLQKLGYAHAVFENNVEKMECINCGYSESQTEPEVEAASGSKNNVIGLFKPD